MPNKKIKDLQYVRAIHTAFDGLDPDGNDYFFRSAHVKVVFPLVAGTRATILTIGVPPHMVYDISTLEFFGLVQVGGNWAEVANDFAKDALIHRILHNNTSPWNYGTQNFAGVTYNGTDVLNTNILSLGDTPGHLVFMGGSTIILEVETILAAWIAPVSYRAGVRIGGREIQKDKWEDVAV